MDKYLISYKENVSSEIPYSFKIFAENSTDALHKFWDKYGKDWYIYNIDAINKEGIIVAPLEPSDSNGG